MSHTFEHNREDELLETLWAAHEACDLSANSVRERYDRDDFDETLLKLFDDGLASKKGDDLLLSDEGYKIAEGIKRRHRLAERLLVDVLGMPVDETEKSACEFEHLVAPQIANSICILLGHPRNCPHGMPIPMGECCHDAANQAPSGVVRLTELSPGAETKVAYVNSSDQGRMQKLIQMGLTPGASVRLKQKSPAFVVETNETQLAMAKDIANDLFVWLP